jgi:signal recognition particle subunit SRP54
MFEALQDGLSSAFKTLRGQGKLSEANMRDGLKLVERSLLEADVSFSVVRDFMKRVTDEAVGERVLKSLNPSQQIIGIVYQALIELMGPVDHSLHLKGRNDVTVLMMCGLQGSGKTTTSGKLGRMLKSAGRSPLLVACDLQRPAAIDQLHIIGDQLGIPVFSNRTEKDPVAVTRAAMAEAKKQAADVLILDTAGRLHIDDELMEQLKRIDRQASPDQVLLVIDSMTGQDAVNSAKAFNDALELDGVILTKLDGDARGGAALSVKEVVGRPIAFATTGEKIEDLDLFHPDRLAGRILGMGDVLTLIEKAEEVYEAEQAEEAAARLMEGRFTLDDFLEQLQQIKKMGPLSGIMGMLPGIPKEVKDADIDEGELGRIEAIIRSMTVAERVDPRLIDGSRRRRIAEGSGTSPNQVNQLVKQFRQMQQMMRKMGAGGPPGAKGRKGKQKKGGRTTAKGAAPIPKVPLELPGLNS